MRFWNDRVKEFKDDPVVSMKDVFSMDLEVAEIIKYLEDGQDILNIGCGNGFKDIEYAKVKKVTVKGIDYAEEMIKTANKSKEKASGLMGTVAFEMGDVLELNKPKTYDVVITNRCLINLENHKKQYEAINNICKLVKDGGLFLMMECTDKGLDNINRARAEYGLEILPIPPWNNCYMVEDDLVAFFKERFRSVEINCFNSTYYLVSRTLNALLTPEGEEIDYYSKLNEYAKQLPVMGDYSPCKLFVLRK